MNERIALVRKSLGLTQEKFAEQVGLSRNFMWMIESGTRVPSDRTISDICREFNVNETWLRTGEGKMKATISNAGLWRCWQSWSPRTGSFWSGWLKSCKKKRKIRKGSPSFATLIYFTSPLACSQISRKARRSARSSSLVIASM